MVTKGKLRETKLISQKVQKKKIIKWYAVICIKRICKRTGGLIAGIGKVVC